MNHCGPHEAAELAMLLSLSALRDDVLQHSFHSFRRAGWPGAKLTLTAIIKSALRSYASDESIATSNRALHDVFAALRLTPELCRKATYSSLTEVAFPQASNEVRQYNEACWREAGSGFGRRTSGLPRILLTQHEAGRVLTRARNEPDALTYQQSYAVDHPANSDVSAADVCEGTAKLLGNETGLGAATLGALRRELAREEGDLDAALLLHPLVKPPPPPDFKCPPVGTQVTVNLHDIHGRPVRQLILGRRNWDCHIQSSVSGDRDFRFSDAQSTVPARNIPDWLPQLWPLSVGKTVHNEYFPAVGDGREEDDTVTSYGPRLIGHTIVPAYEVTQDITIGGGKQHFRFVDYWAPSVGYQIAHRTVVLSGPRPDEDSPD